MTWALKFGNVATTETEVFVLIECPCDRVKYEPLNELNFEGESIAVCKYLNSTDNKEEENLFRVK